MKATDQKFTKRIRWESRPIQTKNELLSFLMNGRRHYGTSLSWERLGTWDLLADRVFRGAMEKLGVGKLGEMEVALELHQNVCDKLIAMHPHDVIAAPAA